MFPRLPVFSLFLLVCCACGVVAGPPDGEAASRRDRYGDALPPGAIARLGTIRFRQAAGLKEVALSPDGKILALSGKRCLHLVNSDSGETIRTIKLPMAVVGSIRFSADSKRFAVIRGDTSAPSPLPEGEHPDDKPLLAGEVTGGKILVTSNIPCFRIAFAPDGRLFSHHRGAGPGADGFVICWDVERGEEVWRSPDVVCFTVAPDGKSVAGGDRGGTVLLWDAASGRERARLGGRDGAIQAVAFSPDGRTLVSASGAMQFNGKPDPKGQGLRAWDVATGKERYRCQGGPHRVNDIRFAPDGRTFATLEDRQNLRLWNAADGTLRQFFPSAKEEEALAWCALAFSPDGKTLCYSSTLYPEATLHQWDIVAGKEMRHWNIEWNPFLGLAVSPDGKRLYAQSYALRSWDLVSGHELHAVPAHRTAIVSLAFSPDGRRLVSRSSGLDYRLWDPLAGTPLACFAAEPGGEGDFAAFSADGRFLLAVTRDAIAQVWDASSGKEVRQFPVGGRATRRAWQRLVKEDLMDEFTTPSVLKDHVAAYHAGKNLLAIFAADQHIHLWDAAQGKQLRRLNGHRGELLDLAFSARGNVLLSRGEDETLRVWNVDRGEEVVRFTVQGGFTGERFALSADQRLLAWVAGDDGIIHLWDAAARKEVRRLSGHRGEIKQLRFQGAGSLLVSCGEDRSVRLWDTGAGAELDRFVTAGEEATATLLFPPDGHVLALGNLKSETGYQLRDLTSGHDVCEVSPWSSSSLTFTRDGRTLALMEEGKLILRERVTGGIVAEIPDEEQGFVTCLAFSPDGRHLASGGQHSSILVWDWQRLAGLHRAAGTPIEERELQAAWNDLAAMDARKGYRAIGTLIAASDRAVSLLRNHLRPATAVRWQAVRDRIARLDDADFAGREKASQELLALGCEARLFLCRASKDKTTLETRRRLEQVLDSAAMRRPSGESIRKVRAVQVLEGIGSPAARELLTAWAAGDRDDWLTQEARQALHRLGQATPSR